MLYLRGLTLKTRGTAKKPDRYLMCSFSADTNKYAVTRNCSLWESNNEQRAAFTALCADFSVDEENTLIPVTTDEEFGGDFFEEEVSPHYVLDDNGEKRKDDDGKEIVSHTLRGVYCTTFGQTKESVIKSFERSWAKNKLLVPTEDE